VNFQEALKILNIEEYGERIFRSNSHGELFHCIDYIYWLMPSTMMRGGLGSGLRSSLNRQRKIGIDLNQCFSISLKF